MNGNHKHSLFGQSLPPESWLLQVLLNTQFLKFLLHIQFLEWTILKIGGNNGVIFVLLPNLIGISKYDSKSIIDTISVSVILYKVLVVLQNISSALPFSENCLNLGGNHHCVMKISDKWSITVIIPNIFTFLSINPSPQILV